MTSYNATREDDWSGGAVVVCNPGSGTVVARPADRQNGSTQKRAVAIVPPPGAGPTRYDVVEHRQNQEKYPYEGAVVAGGNSAFAAPPSLAPTSAFDVVFGSDISATFWKPSAAKGQRGLLEELNRRTTSNSTYLLVSSRPEEELAHNFSTPDDHMFNLNHEQFKVSRTMLAFNRLDTVDDNFSITGRDFKEGLKGTLPSLQQEVYYLLKYRDYSDWAVKNHYSQSKRDGTWRPLYVEKFFVLKTGACAGVLIPITEAQLIYGHELLLKEALNVPKMSSAADNAANDAQNSKYALTADQFRSIGVVVDESVFVNPYLDPSTGRQQATPPPSVWDWTPSGIKRRFNKYLEDQYIGLGRLVVRGAIVGLCGYIVLRSVRNMIGAGEPQQVQQRRGGRGGRRGYANDEPSAKGMIGSVLGFSPKAVFDTILA